MWNEGYVAEIDYIHGYFGELAPPRLRLALLSRGVAHSVGNAPTYLELGFGQGVSLAVNAATNSGRFFGTDFNPSQVANANELLATIGKEVATFEDSFEEFGQRQDLPDFDVIVLHGIWSWISDTSRAAIVALAKKKLKPGGILYLSYNVLAGWTASVPLRHLLREFSRRSSKGAILHRVEESIDFADQLVAAGAGYFAANPGAVERLNAIKGQNKTYLSHEYFNENWLPMSFTEVSDILGAAKLSFAASASLFENIDSISVPAASQPLLNGISDPGLREVVRDLVVNQQFRRDIFVKGVRHMTLSATMAEVRKQEFILIAPPEAAPEQVRGGAGEAQLRPDVYQPIVAAICASPDRPMSTVSLALSLDEVGLSEGQIWEALLVLAGANFIAPLPAEPCSEEDISASQALNVEICRRSAHSNEIGVLAAPVIGSGIPTSKIEQLFLLGGVVGARDLATFAMNCLVSQGESIVVEGRTVEDASETQKILETSLGEFQEKRLPILLRLKCVV